MSETQSLFRSEVQSARPDSNALVQRATPILLLSAFGAALFVALIVLLISTRYKETQQARGVLQATEAGQEIRAPAVGRIDHWHVSEGDRVQQGQILATLSRKTYDERGNQSSQLQVEELRQKLALLVREIELAKEQLNIVRQNLGRALVDNKELLTLLEQESEFTSEQLTIGERQLVALQILMNNSGSTSRLEIDRQRATNLELRRQQSVARRRFQEQKTRVSNLEQESESLQLKSELQLLPLLKQKVDLEQEIRQATRTDFFVVVAEREGRVAAIAQGEGQAVRSNQLMAHIGALNDAVEAVIYVPSGVAGKLRLEQEILLSFDAFDFHQYGRYPARITHISHASLDPRELLLPVPGLNEPVFRLTAVLEQQQVRGPVNYSLQPGLLFTADFVLEELPLFYFIMRPILELRGRVS